MAVHIEFDEVAWAESGDDYSLLPLVLDEVNDIRTACLIGEGKLAALPQGHPKNSESCVIAVALSNGWSPSVDGEHIYLAHDNAEQFDLAGMVAALRNLGFVSMIAYEDVEVDYDEEAEEPVYEERPVGVRLACTPVMGVFIDRFDAGFFPDLVLSD